MNDAQTLDRRLGTIAWSMLFIWWGLRWWPFASLPDGTGLLGTGLILLGLNAVRSLTGIPTKGFTSILGILALVWGGLDLARSLLHVPSELPVIAISLIVLGLILLARELRQVRKTDVAHLH